jgi:heptosyltransferase II
MGLSTVEYVRGLFPEAEVLYGVPQWVAPVFEKVSTPAHRIVGIDLKGPRGWLRLTRQLKRERPDVVLELFQSGRTANLFGLLAPVLGFRYCFHNHHLKSGTGIIDQGVIKPVIQRDLDGAASLLTQEKRPPSYLDYPPRMEVRSAGKGDYLILGVVATRATKYWPLENFVELSRLLQREFPHLGIKIPISTSEADGAVEKTLRAKGLSDGVEIVKAGLSELPALLAGARLYVGNDTGLKHIAVATGTRTLTFFGPELPLEWHPYSAEKHPFFFLENLLCRTVTHHYCRLTECDTMLCLKEYKPRAVADTIARLLAPA